MMTIYRIVEPTTPLHDVSGFPNDYLKYRGVYRLDWDSEEAKAYLAKKTSKQRYDYFLDRTIEGGFADEKDALELHKALTSNLSHLDLIKITACEKIEKKPLFTAPLLGYDVAQPGADWWSAIFTRGAHPGLVELYEENEFKQLPKIKHFQSNLNESYLFHKLEDAFEYLDYYPHMPNPEKDIELKVLAVELLKPQDDQRLD